jgi:hypothetical protein
MSKRIFTVDLDDYCDNTLNDTVGPLRELKEEHPGLKVTLFTIPMRTSIGTIQAAKALGDWIQLAPHGWWHTRGECLAWTDEEAYDKITAAKEMGIDAPIFRAPAWLLDGDTYAACKKLDYVVASHRDLRQEYTGQPEFIYNDPFGRTNGVRSVHGHVSPVSGNFIRDMIKDGRLSFPKKATFIHTHEAAVVYQKKQRARGIRV